MAPHETQKPEAGASGGVEELAGTPTHGLYPVHAYGTEAEAVAAREREAESLDAEVKAIAKRLQILMLVDDEVGARAARAYDDLTSAVFIPTTVWSVGLAIAWSTCGAVYGSERATRARFAKPLREVLAIAAEIKTELRRAA